jgi:hypothetical protein
MAQRMEATGVAGRIQMSAETMERLRDRFDFEPRVVEVKGLGALTAYLWSPTVDIAPQLVELVVAATGQGMALHHDAGTRDR